MSLYCQIPFGQMHDRNPVIVVLAQRLGRTPSAVAMKLVNFASFDPALQARGIRGMGNTSRLDRHVWDAFYGRWDQLAAVEVSTDVVESRWTGRPTAAERTITVRIGQGFFRNAVLSAYEGKCCITAIAEPGLLRASHIVPWSASEARRLDPSNGLCLNALHDAAFDRGLIGIDDEMKVLVSRSARDAMPADVFDVYFQRYTGRRIRLPERFCPDAATLRHHLNNVFLGDA